MIKIDLDLIMVKRRMKLIELSKKIGITPSNLSNLKNGKHKSIRFELLDQLCDNLQCLPSDILIFVKEDSDDVATKL